MGCGQKSVVRVAQRVAALVPVQGLSSLFSNVHCLFDPSCAFVSFSVQNSGGRPIDHVVLMRCMVSQCGANLFLLNVLYSCMHDILPLKGMCSESCDLF